MTVAVAQRDVELSSLAIEIPVTLEGDDPLDPELMVRPVELELSRKRVRPGTSPLRSSELFRREERVDEVREHNHGQHEPNQVLSAHLSRVSTSSPLPSKHWQATTKRAAIAKKATTTAMKSKSRTGVF